MKTKYTIVYTGDPDAVTEENGLAFKCRIYNSTHIYSSYKNALRGFDDLVNWFGRGFDQDILTEDNRIRYNTQRLEYYEKEYQSAIEDGLKRRAAAMNTEIKRTIAYLASNREGLRKSLEELALFHVKPIPFSIMEVKFTPI